MARRIRKISSDCPKCGHSQAEPSDFISTLCQHCGTAYSRVGPKTESSPTGGFPRFFGAKLPLAPAPKPTTRSVFCYRCGKTHKVSPHARSTICDGCNAPIQLEDISIEGNASRSIDTRGDLHVGPGGNLNTTSTYCANATIQGRISGLVICEKTVTISSKGRCHARIEAQTVIIDRHADLAFYFPICAQEIIVRGHAAALIYCSGLVTIQKSGSLDGDIRARAFQVDKGGNFLGKISINTTAKSEFHTMQQEFPFLPLSLRPPQVNSDYAQS